MVKNIVQIKVYKYNGKIYDTLDEAQEQYVKDVFSTISKENYGFFDDDMNPSTPEEVFKSAGNSLCYCYIGCKEVMDFLNTCVINTNFNNLGLWRWDNKKNSMDKYE